jgi:hypothetical protein
MLFFYKVEVKTIHVGDSSQILALQCLNIIFISIPAAKSKATGWLQHHADYFFFNNSDHEIPFSGLTFHLSHLYPYLPYWIQYWLTCRSPLPVPLSVLRINWALIKFLLALDPLYQAMKWLTSAPSIPFSPVFILYLFFQASSHGSPQHILLLLPCITNVS